jgi:hypothetical protein
LFYNVWYGTIIQRIQFFFYLKSHSINNERSDLNWLKNINYNYNLRFKYKEKNKNKLKDKFEDIIFSDLLSFLPKIYLEGFKKLSHKSFDQFKNLNTKINSEVPFVDAGSKDILQYPFVHMTGHGNVVFTNQELDNLRT